MVRTNSYELAILNNNRDNFVKLKVESLATLCTETEKSNKDTPNETGTVASEVFIWKCNCCTGGLSKVYLEGVKLDVAINGEHTELISGFNFPKSRQRDNEAIVRKQDAIICKRH